MAKSIGEEVEDLACHGIPTGTTLTDAKRNEIIEFAIGFEECGNTKPELDALTDKDLITAAYWVMADYARGQM